MTGLPVEVRCPLNPARLFMLISVDPDVQIVSGNLIEVSCRDCKKATQAQEPWHQIVRVTHQFNVLGELVGGQVLAAG